MFTGIIIEKGLIKEIKSVIKNQFDTFWQKNLHRFFVAFF